MNQSRVSRIFILVLSLCLTVACSRVLNRPPSNEVIERAIMERGASNLVMGRIPLKSVEVQQVGNYHEAGKYWAVKARVQTKFQTVVLDYQIYKDDFGNWAARQAPRR